MLAVLVSRRSHGIRHSCHGSATGETRGRNYARNAESWSLRAEKSVGRARGGLVSGLTF